MADAMRRKSVVVIAFTSPSSHFRERLRRLQPDTAETRLLYFLVEQRRRTVDDRTRASNRLNACLKLYFPQMLQWFEDLTSPLVGDLLERWPQLKELQRAHPGTLRKFFHQHNCRSDELIRERIAAIHFAIPATLDAAVLEAGRLIARGLVAQLATLRMPIASRWFAKTYQYPANTMFRGTEAKLRAPDAGECISREVNPWKEQLFASQPCSRLSRHAPLSY
jgi:hypothetical protein